MVLWAVVEVGIYQELRVRDILNTTKHKLQIKFVCILTGYFWQYLHYFSYYHPHI